MTEPVKRRKKPSSDDPAKKQRIDEVRRMLLGKQRPDPYSRGIRVTAFEGISSTNELYLSGVKFSEKPWVSALWWCAKDLAANDIPLEEVLDLLIDTADAWVDAERQDLALRTIVNAYYFQPKITARAYAEKRRERRGGNGSGNRPSPSSRSTGDFDS
jgi:hypothetical protein